MRGIWSGRGLSLLLWGVTAHSAAIGVGLLALPPSVFALFGYQAVSEPFFPRQGGVFHLAMCAVYGCAAWDPLKNAICVRLTVTVKLVATVFLTLYFLLGAPILTVILSAGADLAMAVVVAWAASRAGRATS
jgi:hypothetical protein